MGTDLVRPKLLVLLRHAKSSWKSPELPDIDRPLNKRGRAAAPLVGAWLKDKKILPDRTICSPARRALDTAELVLAACGLDAALEIEPALYLAEPDRIWDVARARGRRADCLMIVGHNDGLELLVSEIAEAPIRFPTGAVAIVRVETARWTTASRADSTLREICRPRDLSTD